MIFYSQHYIALHCITCNLLESHQYNKWAAEYFLEHHLRLRVKPSCTRAENETLKICFTFKKILFSIIFNNNYCRRVNVRRSILNMKKS